MMRTGLRIRGQRGHPEVKAAVIRFAKWLRTEYDFPIRVPVYLLPGESFLTVDGENGEFSIWINSEQDFNVTHFLKDIPILEFDAPETIYQSFGPAEIIEKYPTKDSDFFISQEFDEYAGTTIYSGNLELMNKIYKLMLSSGDYHER